MQPASFSAKKKLVCKDRSRRRKSKASEQLIVFKLGWIVRKRRSRAALESEKRVCSQKGPLLQLFAGEPWGVAVQSTERMYQVQAETS